MGDEPTKGIEPEEKSGLSRRAALKAGVAVGVGIAAWSGASITSLGGTPAYAQTTTGVIILELSGGCTNTDGGAGCVPASPFRFHTLETPPAPFSLQFNPGQGTCCNGVVEPELHWTEPPDLACTVRWEMYIGQQACLNRTGILIGFGEAMGSDGAGGLAIPLDCGSSSAPNAFYRIVAACSTGGGPPPTFAPPTP